jgi:hypothetical protein
MRPPAIARIKRERPPQREDAPHVSGRRLSIVVGITGHRHLRPQDEAALAAAVDEILARLQSAYPSTPLLLLTPLAEGADWLAADVARRRSIPYRVPLPMPLANYREDFAGPERAGPIRRAAARRGARVVARFPRPAYSKLAHPRGRAAQWCYERHVRLLAERLGAEELQEAFAV